MEKKLTDEEIVKALKVVGKETLAFAYDKEQRQFKYVTAKEILDLIHRLQDEIKYKTECYDELCNTNNDMACEISEQKAKIERLTEELKYYRGELL